MEMEPQIVFEDENLLLVVKPAGMVVNRAETVEQGTTLQDWVEKSNKLQVTSDKTEIEKIFLQRSGIAHRLDKETSGVMVIGKTPESLAHLMKQFKERTTKKEYVALVHGMLEPKTGIINLPIGRSPYNRHKFRVDVFGKAAVTSYNVEKKFESSEYQDGFSLVRLFPKTGRTHQIRVHMTQIGHPLVGDELYGGRKRTLKDRLWCPRHFLHAATLGFFYPGEERWVSFEAPLPDDLTAALGYL